MKNKNKTYVILNEMRMNHWTDIDSNFQMQKSYAMEYLCIFSIVVKCAVSRKNTRTKILKHKFNIILPISNIMSANNWKKKINNFLTEKYMIWKWIQIIFFSILNDNWMPDQSAISFFQIQTPNHWLGKCKVNNSSW